MQWLLGLSVLQMPEGFAKMASPGVKQSLFPGGGNSRKHSTVNGTARSPTSRIAQSGSLQQKCRS
jgi:hypothetical protein